MLQALLPAGGEAILAGVATWLITYLLHSTLFLALAWAVDGRTPATRSPSARSTLWTAAMVAGLATATLQALAGPGPGARVEVADSEKLVAELAPPSGVDAVAAPGPTAGGVTPRGGDASRRGTAPSVWRRPHGAGLEGGWRHLTAHGWPFLLAAAALLATLSGLGRWAARWWRLRRRLRGRSPVRAGPLRRALDDVRTSTGGPGGVRLTRSPEVPCPVALPGREICVPDALPDDVDGEGLRAILAHELVHLERRDPLRLLGASALEAVLAIQPLNRLARRRIVRAAEAGADRSVRRLGLGAPLADALVTAAASRRAVPEPAPAAGLASASPVRRRVEALLAPDDGDVAGAAPAWILPAVAAGLLTAGALAGPSVRVGLTEHRAHVDGRHAGRATVDVTSRPARDAGPAGGDVAHLELSGAVRPVRITLRPGRGRLSLTLPGGETVTAASGPPAADARPTLWVVRVEDAGAGDYVLHVPRRVERLAVEVNGRLLAGPASTAAGELPELLPRAPGRR